MMNHKIKYAVVCSPAATYIEVLCAGRIVTSRKMKRETDPRMVARHLGLPVIFRYKWKTWREDKLSTLC